MRERQLYIEWSEKVLTGRRQSWEVVLAEGTLGQKP